MKPIVYVETSVISYLAAQPSRDLVVAAHQQVTRQWWSEARPRVDLLASDLVVQESSAGNPEAAAARLAILEQLSLATTYGGRERSR